MLAITYRKNLVLILMNKSIEKTNLIKVGLSVDDDGYVTYDADDQKKYEDSQRKAKLYNALELLFPLAGGILGYKLFKVPGAVIGTVLGIYGLIVWEIKVRKVGLM